MRSPDSSKVDRSPRVSGGTTSVCRRALGALTAAAFVLLTAPSRASIYLPAIGAPNFIGPQFTAPCPDDQRLVGVELRVGQDVDAIRPLCALVITPTSANPPQLTTDSGLMVRNPTGLLNEPGVAPGWFGGPGGGIVRLLCPRAQPVVVAIRVGIEIERVNNVHLHCAQAVADSVYDYFRPSAIFDGEQGAPAIDPYGFVRCPAGQVAVGMHGRSVYNEASSRRGVYLGALGLICERAREAQARNTSAAAQLAALCRATPATAMDRTRIGEARITPGATGPPSPDVAPDLEAFAARGAALAAADALATRLREAQPTTAGQRGFDIGAVASEGQTAWGPGKQRILDSLPPAERDGSRLAGRARRPGKRAGATRIRYRL